ncbi:MAG TPA: hypothetical protein DD381_14640 [Lentisphaeria bacterium]|nr:MAG: hypothetical protein A2X47_01455 [Lentisphaerae bacterium GWF2_38_69]HBM17562.1 hypothetical protein [Lentisphaeria bacterium]
MLKNIIFCLCFLLSVLLVASDAVLLFTTDIHGNITSEEGGLLKLASAVKEQESKEGKEKILLIDCGDTLQGSYESAQTRGSIIIEIMNLIGYDFWIPGNHDFDYGFDLFQQRASEFKGTVLASNIETVHTGSKPYQSYAIVKINNLKIALIGATFPFINNSEIITPYAAFRTLPLSPSLDKIMTKVLKTDPDVIVLAVHGGLYNKKWMMSKELKRFPQIDIILGGHTHEDIDGKRLFNNAYFFQAGYKGEYLGRIDITKNTKSGKIEIKSKLISVKEYPNDKNLESKISPQLDAINREGEEKVAYINSKEAIEGGFLIAESMKVNTQSDVAIFGLSQRTDKVAGNIDLRDVYDFISHEDYVSNMYITKDELKIILEDLFKRKKGKYKKVYWDGFKFQVSKKGKILGLTFPEELQSKHRIKLAIPSYYIEYPTIKFPDIRHIAEQKDSKYSNSKKTVREGFIEFIIQKFQAKKQP